MQSEIRRLLNAHGRLPFSAETLSETQDLYVAGLTSFAAVQLMLGLEEAFDVEFPERMLNRRSFQSIAAISTCVAELQPQKLAS